MEEAHGGGGCFLIIRVCESALPAKKTKIGKKVNITDKLFEVRESHFGSVFEPLKVFFLVCVE